MQWDKIYALSIPEDYRACLRVLALDKVSEVFVADLPDLEEAAPHGATLRRASE